MIKESRYIVRTEIVAQAVWEKERNKQHKNVTLTNADSFR